MCYLILISLGTIARYSHNLVDVQYFYIMLNGNNKVNPYNRGGNVQAFVF